MVRGIQTNVRLPSEIHAILEHIANNMSITSASLSTKIITEYVEFYYYKIQRGDMTLSQPILKKMFDAIDSSKIDEIAQFTAKFILSEISIQEGEIPYDTFVQRIIKWNKGNNLNFNKIKKPDTELFISKHSLGKNWSELQCKIYANAFEAIGCTVIEKNFDSPDFYSIEIRH